MSNCSEIVSLNLLGWRILHTHEKFSRKPLDGDLLAIYLAQGHSATMNNEIAIPHACKRGSVAS
jgi:hypothetical protein